MSPALHTLRDPLTIRERCARIAAAVEAGESQWFSIDPTRAPAVADLVAEVTREHYPDLAVPYHSRWRHFEAGGVDRLNGLRQALDGAALARANLDLTVVSVLLDAGAGPDWGWQEAGGARYTRSEGLAVASVHAFLGGAFSATPGDPWRVDPEALRGFDSARLAALFQVRADNPLTGLEGRAALLRRLGQALAARPGALFDRFALAGTVQAAELLRALLDDYSEIWLAPNRLHGAALGDVWRHPQAGGDGDTHGWVPFHKLSQWLSYSLIEPLEAAGLRVSGLDALTALPEYRNGGLLLDSGWLRLRDPGLADRAWQVGDELVVEWRALTIALIDRLRPLLNERFGRALPLASLLQGGTWNAGRRLAAARRHGRPPLNIVSDGTVF